LERDQVASLLTGMAVDGIVDFSKANLFDRAWYTRLLLLSKIYQKNKQAKYLAMCYDRAIAGISSGNYEFAKKCIEQSEELVGKFNKLNMPWLDTDTKPKTKYNEYLDAIAEYKRLFGDQQTDTSSAQESK
jgi:hypothetical protein